MSIRILEWILRESREPDSQPARLDRPMRAIFCQQNGEFITFALNYQSSGLSLYFHEGDKVDNKLQVHSGPVADDEVADLCKKYLKEVITPYTGLQAKATVDNSALANRSRYIFFDLVPATPTT